MTLNFLLYFFLGTRGVSLYCLAQMKPIEQASGDQPFNSSFAVPFLQSCNPSGTLFPLQNAAAMESVISCAQEKTREWCCEVKMSAVPVCTAMIYSSAVLAWPGDKVQTVLPKNYFAKVLKSLQKLYAWFLHLFFLETFTHFRRSGHLLLTQCEFCQQS